MRLALIQPFVLFLVAVAIGGFWAWRRQNEQVAMLAVALGIYAIGMLTQLVQFPPGSIANAVCAALLYCLATLAVTQATNLRTPLGNRSMLIVAAIGAATIAGILYFSTIRDDVASRVYVINFGLGTMYLATAWFARGLASGKTLDKVVFWLLVIVGLHFFPKTIVTTDSLADTDLATFAQTSFWTSTLMAFAILGVVMGIAAIVVTTVDLMTTMQLERDTDALTGLPNRRGLEIASLDLRSDPKATPVTLVVCDLDNFEMLTDRYGQQASNVVLRKFAEMLRINTRMDDLAARMGNADFALVLAHMDAEKAYGFAERLRLATATMDLTEIDDDLYITCSIGVVQIREEESFGDALARADELVYAAKHNGRNRSYAEGIGPAGRGPRPRKAAGKGSRS